MGINGGTGIVGSGSVLGGSGISVPKGGVAPFVGLLDEYSNAAAAYSVRKLSSDYATPTDSEFSFGGALQFDGVNDFVEFAPISLNDFTVNLWFNANLIAGASFRGLIGNSADGNIYILLYNNNGTNSIRVSCGTIDYFYYNVPAFSLSTWNMLTVKRSGSNVQVFFNGNESSTGALVINSNSISFNRLGSYSSITNNYMFNGKQDEIAIWNTALSATDIANLYNEIDGVGQGDFATNYSPANLQAYWRANDGSGTTLTDEQGTYNGTLTNFDTNVCWVDGKANKGALVEIRRSSDDLVKNFYYDSNNELSLDSTDWNGTTLSSWIGSDDGFVRTWYDQSGNANNAQQTNTSLQPQIVSSGSLIQSNSKPSIAFDLRDNLNLSSINGYTVFNVSKLDAFGIRNYLSWNGSLGFQLRGLGGGIGVWNSSDGGYTVDQDLNQHLSYFRYTGTAYDMDFDNNGIETTGAQALVPVINIGRNDNNFSINGKTQELIYYATDQASNKAGISSNINSYYSIYSPPSGIGTWAIGTTFVIQ